MSGGVLFLYVDAKSVERNEAYECFSAACICRVHFRKNSLPPRILCRHYFYRTASAVVARVCSRRVFACLYGLDRLQKYLTRRDDRLVRRPEMLFGSVRYPALQFLNGAVLGIDANDTGEVLGALGLAVD